MLTSISLNRLKEYAVGISFDVLNKLIVACEENIVAWDCEFSPSHPILGYSPLCRDVRKSLTRLGDDICMVCPLRIVDETCRLLNSLYVKIAFASKEDQPQHVWNMQEALREIICVFKEVIKEG